MVWGSGEYGADVLLPFNKQSTIDKMICDHRYNGNSDHSKAR